MAGPCALATRTPATAAISATATNWISVFIGMLLGFDATTVLECPSQSHQQVLSSDGFMLCYVSGDYNRRERDAPLTSDRLYRRASWSCIYSIMQDIHQANVPRLEDGSARQNDQAKTHRTRHIRDNRPRKDDRLLYANSGTGGDRTG